MTRTAVPNRRRILGAASALGASLVLAVAPAGAQAPPVAPVNPPALDVPPAPGAAHSGVPSGVSGPSGPALGGAAAATAASSQQAQPLVGTFALTAGTCPGGSYFRMIQPGGSATGPFVINSDSPCEDKTYTPLGPGSDGGLVAGSYQPHPEPPFDPAGGARADRITQPQRFYGVNFSTATNRTDPQSGRAVPAPSVVHDGAGRLSGDLRAFAASWNNQHFNQGAPKPDGSRPGNTSPAAGTYDAASGAFVLEWRSQVVGGPFNNFTGVWHLEGSFRSSAPGPAAASAPKSAADAGAANPAPGAARAPAVTATTPKPLARTGPPFSPWYGIALGAAGLAGLCLARGPGRRPEPVRAAGPPHG